MITKILLEVLAELGEAPVLIDRRFSREIGEVGALSARKIAAAPALAVRLILVLLKRPRFCVFFCTNRSFSFLVDVVLGELLRFFRIPTVNYIHTRGYSELAERGRIWRFLVSRLLRGAIANVCLGETLKADLLPFVAEGTISVVKNTVEVPPPEAGMRQRGHILFLSNLLEEKGADVFVEMAIEMCGISPDRRFSLVGAPVDDGLLAELRERVRKSGLSGRIVFLGPLFGAEKWNALASAEVLVFPTRYRFEAQPLTIIEAFSVGVPVVATNIGSIGDLVEDGVNGWLVAEANVNSVKEAVLKATSEPATSDRLAVGARRTFEQMYSREVFRAEWSRVIAGMRK
ncbi:glycosyltransferase family 4 protein [Curtobacterium sp. PhB137]|uniref:glycosyltransferase family 4 protein n=1 Tax=Curtobacterium sp. PhB137 TaxID=2485182 RepID=UPI00160A1210|nr:glycosyltransferase family 4 protein [Curtobacterium sp. PhB137]